MFRKILIAVTLFISTRSVATADEPKIEVYFSPHGGCTAAISKEISNAKTSIAVQAFSFTSPPIGEALIEAKKRGVSVLIILDKSNLHSRGSQLANVSDKQIPVRIDGKHAIAHNKVIIIDQSTTITGSFNFSTNAENSNAENLLIIHDTETAKKYQDNWNTHWEHATPFK
jgi:phosphatidylserine/phosphatidylglycerophosphate/cardiolipin synthase-like enzyme